MTQLKPIEKDGNYYCSQAYQNLLEGSYPKLCNRHLGKPESGECEDCIVYQHIQEALKK